MKIKHFFPTHVFITINIILYEREKLKDVNPVLRPSAAQTGIQI